MELDYEAAHRGIVDYFRSRGLEWGGAAPGDRPAILVIDMAYGWTDPTYAGGSLQMSQAVEWIARLLEGARPLGVPVIYTTSPRPYGLWSDSSASEEEKAALAQAHRSSRIDERIAPRAGDTVLYKSGSSAFFNTGLHRHLRSLQVDTLLITGCVTSTCVRASVVDASDCGFRNILVRQCIADRSESEHAWHIRDLTRWGKLLGVDDALAYLRKVAPG